jgi:pimeloyl-ACP methyl ester carboxylesterase
MPVNLYCETQGQGDPLIIIHGLLGSSSNWSKTSELLGKRLQVFTLDLRNHGNSPHSTEFDFISIVEDLKLFMESRNLRHAAILGHSFGGKVAMEFADHYPEMVDKLIIVDVAPKAYVPTHKALVEAMLALDLAKYKNINEVVNALASAIPSLQIRNFQAKNLIRLATGGLSWKVNLRAIRDNINVLSEGTALKNCFRKPSLFIRGELSDYILDEDEVGIRNMYPCAEIVTVEGAGHWVHIDARESFVDIILKYVADV